jgi:hypothetical protein
MTTLRRTLVPACVAPAGRAGLQSTRLGFRLAATAVATQFVISASLLYWMGINYDTPGGNPIVKFHLATYLVALAVFVTLREQGGSGLARLFRDSPALVVFIGTILLCTLYSVASVGMSGAATLIESYVSAGLLAITLRASEAAERRTRARLMLALCLANVAVVVGETLAHAHLVPLYLGPTPTEETASDFRGTALFDHALTGSAVVMMGLLTLPAMRLRTPVAVSCAVALCVGLLAFSERVALAVILAVFTLAAAGAVLRGLARRRLDPRLVGAILLAALVVPPAAYLLRTQTPIGVRLLTHLYVDQSARTRDIQWLVLGRLSLRDLLFGVQEGQIRVLTFWLGLDRPFDNIENPWLLAFLKLGAVGFVLFLAGLVPFVAWLWRRARGWGRVVLLCGLVVASASNSLGRKSNLLFLLTAFVMASTGFTAETVPAEPLPLSRGHEPNLGCGLRPARLSSLSGTV